MFARHPLRTGFRVIAATAVVAGAVMNLATLATEHAARMSVTAPF
ncbi:hypothetical protein ACFPN2_00640 [Steroidobacter flavus]|uniref:Uncharacterized protein n=1 Tax=Steroidobacter flavus TaxID=1842136 RepID=A0ABV8SJ00_9GAMM